MFGVCLKRVDSKEAAKLAAQEAAAWGKVERIRDDHQGRVQVL